MEKLLNKLSQYYRLDHMQYTYEIQFYLDVFALAFMNIIGWVWISTPVVFVGSLAFNSPLSQWSGLTIDVFVGFCIFCFFYYGFSYIFFVHNKNNTGRNLLILGWFLLLIGAVATLIHILYHFAQWQIKGFSNISEHLDVFYFDLGLIFVFSLVYFLRSSSFKNFLDRTFERY